MLKNKSSPSFSFCTVAQMANLSPESDAANNVAMTVTGTKPARA
jgi:hypothetical protein